MRVSVLQFRLSVFVTASHLPFSYLPSHVTQYWVLGVLCSVISKKKNLCDGWKSMQWSMLSDLSYLSPNTDTHLGQVFGSESCLCFWQNVSVICHHLIFMPHQIVTACHGSEPLGRQQSSLILSNDSLEQPLSFAPQVQVRSLLNVNI